MTAPPGRTVKIVGLGDSTTAGTPAFLSPLEAPPNGAGDERSQYAYWMMKNHKEWSVLNRGVNGERTDQILTRFQRDVVKERPKVVVILGGVNDIYQGFPTAFAAPNLSAMYSGAAEAGILPVACTVLPYNPMGTKEAAVRVELNRWVGKESGRRKIPFCDTAAAASDPRDVNRLLGSPDGLHPDVDGYRRMAEAISAVVEASLS